MKKKISTIVYAYEIKCPCVSGGYLDLFLKMTKIATYCN